MPYSIDETRQAIRQALKNNDSRVRLAAVIASSDAKLNMSADLKRASNDPDMVVRWAAQRVLVISNYTNKKEYGHEQSANQP